jgi:hypothetical protein
MQPKLFGGLVSPCFVVCSEKARLAALTTYLQPRPAVPPLHRRTDRDKTALLKAQPAVISLENAYPYAQVTFCSAVSLVQAQQLWAAAADHGDCMTTTGWQPWPGRCDHAEGPSCCKPQCAAFNKELFCSARTRLLVVSTLWLGGAHCRGVTPLACLLQLLCTAARCRHHGFASSAHRSTL